MGSWKLVEAVMPKTIPKKVSALVVLGCICLMLAGCSRHATTPSVLDGVVKGQVKVCAGGPTGTIPRALRRFVALRASGRVAAQASVGAPFRFQFRVAPGTYFVTAEGDTAANVVVKAKTTVEIHLHASCGLSGEAELDGAEPPTARQLLRV